MVTTDVLWQLVILIVSTWSRAKCCILLSIIRKSSVRPYKSKIRSNSSFISISTVTQPKRTFFNTAIVPISGLQVGKNSIRCIIRHFFLSCFPSNSTTSISTTAPSRWTSPKSRLLESRFSTSWEYRLSLRLKRPLQEQVEVVWPVSTFLKETSWTSANMFSRPSGK